MTVSCQDCGKELEIGTSLTRNGVKYVIMLRKRYVYRCPDCGCHLANILPIMRVAQ